MGAKITAIEYCFPDQAYTNQDLQKDFPEYDFQKFEEKVGIKIRYITKPDETGLDLAIRACEKLFERIDKSTIDYILYCTQNPEYLMPGTACVLQDRIGLPTNVGALDISLGCSGFVYGTSLAKGLINSGQAKNILFVAANTYTKYIHPLDRSNRSLFGDVATAVLISYSETEMLEGFLFGTDGSSAEKIMVKNGGSRNAYNPDAELITYGTDNSYTDNNFYMDGPAVFDFTNGRIPAFSLELLKHNNIEIDAIDQFIYHQANEYMLNFIRKKLRVAPEKFYIKMEEGGNTGSSTIPIALKRYTEGKTFDRAENILIAGFGVGLSWAGGLIKIDNQL